MRLAHILVCHSVDPTKAIQSIPHRAGALCYVFLHSDAPQIEAAVRRLMGPRDGNVFSYRENRGLAKSWNEGLHLAAEAGCEASLLLNDDLFFYEGGYDAFAATIGTLRSMSRDVAYVTPLGRETGASGESGKILAQNFACCAIMPECIDRVGYFDETFIPAYFEDKDYFRRIILSGMYSHNFNEIIVEHERSSTVQSLNEIEKSWIEAAFICNRDYYHSKWGADESFHRPFNRHDISLRIAFEDRTAPYDIAEHPLKRREDHAPSR